MVKDIMIATMIRRFLTLGLTVFACQFPLQTQATLLENHLQEFGLDELLNSSNQYQLDHLASSTNTSQGCQFACKLLPIFIPGNVSSVGESNYQPLEFWSAQQSSLVPACRVDATSANSVAIVIKVSRLTQCPFAVRSGGHASFAGASSIEGGILVNLGPINSVIPNENLTRVWVGTGNTWSDVYAPLDQLGISVVGGRVSPIGVGGLTLGGGISYFSGRYGWACDNVLSYEVVLANSSIVTASPTSHPDLYHALRGGSGTNFGIVTHFELASFPQGQLWSGNRYHDISANQSLIKAFYDFAIDAPTDPYASLFVSFVYVNETYLASSFPVYGKPVENPPIFEAFTQIPNVEYVSVIDNLTQLTVDLNEVQPVDQRDTYRTVSFKHNFDVLSGVLDIFVRETAPIHDVADLVASFTIQPITANFLSHTTKRGGNVLGIDPNDGPLIIISVAYSWSSAADDARVFESTQGFTSGVVDLARSLGADHPFIYMNYAEHRQDVFGGYGNVSKAFLEGIKKVYDPKDVFGRLQPGYFKL